MKAIKILAAVALVLFVAATGLFFKLYFDKGSPLPVLGQIHEFQLTNSEGKAMSQEDMKGKVWLADFIFTNCGGPCPMMTGKMAGLAERHKNLEDLRFVSISVDPLRDTPEVLQKYAADYGADTSRWHFLTGNPDHIQDLAVKQFKVGSVTDIVIHSERFILVDRTGAIRGYYHSQDAEAMQRLELDLPKLVKSTS